MTNRNEVGASLATKPLSTRRVSMPDSIGVWSGALVRVWNWVMRQSRVALTRGVSRRLSVAETVSLGEKRFVSILQVDGEQFLVGGSQSNIVLLARLEKEPQIRGTFERFLSSASGVFDQSRESSSCSAEATR